MVPTRSTCRSTVDSSRSGDAPSGSLDAVLDLEDAEMAAGYAEGEAAAAADSRAEGAERVPGGFAYGHEVGFLPAARVWKELLLAKADADANGDSSSSPKRPRQPPRQKAALAALEAALRALPMGDSASLHDRLADCRGRFRQAVAAFDAQADAVQPPVRAEIGGAEARVVLNAVGGEEVRARAVAAGQSARARARAAPDDMAFTTFISSKGVLAPATCHSAMPRRRRWRSAAHACCDALTLSGAP